MGLSRYEKCAVALCAVFVVCSSLYFLDRHSDPEPYRIEISAPAVQAVPAPAESEADWPESLLPGEQIDLNTASAADLGRLPGIGEKRAEDIVSFRRAHGGFQTAEQLMDVTGIGEKTFEGLKLYITVGPTD